MQTLRPYILVPETFHSTLDIFVTITSNNSVLKNDGGSYEEATSKQPPCNQQHSRTCKHPATNNIQSSFTRLSSNNTELFRVYSILFLPVIANVTESATSVSLSDTLLRAVHSNVTFLPTHSFFTSILCKPTPVCLIARFLAVKVTVGSGFPLAEQAT